MTPDILSQVRGIAADIFQVDPAALTSGSSPQSIEIWDSVQHLNLVMALEEKFDIQFEPDEMDRMKSIGQIAALLQAKLS